MQDLRFVRALSTATLATFFFAAAGGTVRAQQVPVPGVDGLSVQTTTHSDTTPVAITFKGWHAAPRSQASPGTSYIQCLNVRVLSRKDVTAVRFTLTFEDGFKNSVGTYNVFDNDFLSAGSLHQNSYDPSQAYLDPHQRGELCWNVPTMGFSTGWRNIAYLDIATTNVAFADGSVWTKGQGFQQAFLPNGQAFTGTSVAAAAPPPAPPINVAQNWVDGGHAPVEWLDSATQRDFFSNAPKQCVSFRNISNSYATDVTYSFTYEDASGNEVIAPLQHDFNGTFQPKIEIDDQCFYPNLGPSDGIRQMTHVEIHEASVVFRDGTTWSEGQGFTRAYANDGTPLPQSMAISGYAPNAPAQPQYLMPQPQPYIPPSQAYIPPQAQTYVPAATYAAPPQYQPPAVQRPYALVGLKVSYANAVDRIVPIYAPLGPGLTLGQPVDGQSVGGSGGTQAIFQQPGYVITGIDVYRGVYAGVDEVLGMKLYWNPLTPNGIDTAHPVSEDVMRSSYPQTFPTKQFRADPGTYISSIMITPSTHPNGDTYVHDISIAVTQF